MQVRVATVVFSITLLFIGLGCGLLLARIVAAGPGPSDATLQQADIAPALASLERAIQQLSHDLAVRPTAQPEATVAREPALPGTSSAELLTSSIDKLSALISDRMRGTSTRSTTNYEWKGAGYGSAEVMGQRLKVLVVSQGSEMTPELTRNHLGWTRDDVFERYGPPTSISSSERGLRLMYQFPMPDQETLTVFFLIADGIVANAYAG